MIIHYINEGKFLKSPFIIYAGFVSILVQKDPNDSYKNKYEKRIP